MVLAGRLACIRTSWLCAVTSKLLCDLVSGQLTGFTEPLIPAFEAIALTDVDNCHSLKVASFSRSQPTVVQLFRDLRAWVVVQ